jgi:outer membrane protein assembly factor BamB
MRGDLFVLNLVTGKPEWNYELGAAIVGNPAIANNRIIVTAIDGAVYCFGKK